MLLLLRKRKLQSFTYFNTNQHTLFRHWHHLFCGQPFIKKKFEVYLNQKTEIECITVHQSSNVAYFFFSLFCKLCFFFHLVIWQVTQLHTDWTSADSTETGQHLACVYGSMSGFCRRGMLKKVWRLSSDRCSQSMAASTDRWDLAERTVPLSAGRSL